MAKENIKNINYGFIIIPVILSTFGLIFAYSAGIRPEDGSIGEFFQSQFFRQLLWVITGIGISIIILLIDYYQLVEISGWLYIGGIVLLLITLIFGKEVRGAKSWLGIGGLGIQPSELMKLFYILYFSKYLANAQTMEKKNKVFFISLGLMIIPIGLIMLQPDLGTSIVYVMIFLVIGFMGMSDTLFLRYTLYIGFIMIFLVLGSAYYKFYYLEMRGAPIEFLDIFLSFKTLLIISLSMFLYSAISIIIDFLNPVEIIRKILPITIVTGVSFFLSAFSMKVLKPYQWKRLLVFLNPEFDKYGSGYNIIQSKIAIGSGGLFGRGLFRGTQNNLGFLPEKSTDFIFSIVSEELGFLGSGLIIILFTLYFYYIIKAIKNAKDKEGMLIVSGILAMFFTHFIVNIGMTLGVAPVTGLPLPFISYGGSSYLTFIISAALVTNIYSKRFVH